MRSDKGVLFVALLLLLSLLPSPPAVAVDDPLADWSAPQRACLRIRVLELTQPDKHLERVVDLCDPVAEAAYSVWTGQLVRNVDLPAWDFDTYTLDVLHMLYVVSGESGGDPLANSRNWGCARDERLRPTVNGHPDFVCPFFGGRVPTGYVSHMSHLVEARSQRILGYLIDPFDLYQSTKLAMALVYEKGGNGWYHWWSIHYGLNRYLARHGIRQVWHCPPAAYWADVQAGSGVAARRACT